MQQSETDPFRGTGGEMLTLPDGNFGLDAFYERGARREGLRAMWGRDRGDERDIADDQVPDAMYCRDGQP